MGWWWFQTKYRVTPTWVEVGLDWVEVGLDWVEVGLDVGLGCHKKNVLDHF